MRWKAVISVGALFFAVLFINFLAGAANAAAPAADAPLTDEDVEEEDVKTDKPQRKFTKKQEYLMAVEKMRAKTKNELPPFKMVLVKGGCFEMGDFAGVGDDDEKPVHEVCVSSYYISETEVTQELFEKVMGYNTAAIRDPKFAVTDFNQKIIAAFFKQLNTLTKGKYRLPSEAEWEFAAREGGKKMRWAGTDDEDALGDYAWHDFNSGGLYHPVKQRKPNALGLYDMSGNVSELCDDYFDFEYYKRSPRRDPLNERRAAWRVVRGGSINYDANRVRTTFRYAYDPTLRFGSVGFRLAQ